MKLYLQQFCAYLTHGFSRWLKHVLQAKARVKASVAYLAGPSTGSAFWSLGTNVASTKTGPGWMDNQHSKQGNIGLADGSVQGWTRSRLIDGLRGSGDTGRTPGVFTLASGAVGTGCNRIQLP